MQIKIQSKIGPLYLVASEQGLKGVYFKRQVKAARYNNAANSIIEQTKIQLEQYFQGLRTQFDLPLDLEGTDFQKKVWMNLLKIPFGKTCSYKELAQKIKSPNASRAVGTANGKNPICIIIPCHRVISADGSLGGYSGGLDKKVKLLAIENKSF